MVHASLSSFHKWKRWRTFHTRFFVTYKLSTALSIIRDLQEIILDLPFGFQ